MGILSIFGVGKEAGEVVKSVATPIEALGNVFDKLFTSDEERKAADAVMAKLAQRPMELQAEVNKLEAQHKSWWVAGWRPFIGWVCGASLGMYYLPQFFMAAVLWTRQCWQANELVPYPIADIKGLMQLVIAMLGLGLYRTAEKFVGRTK